MQIKNSLAALLSLTLLAGCATAPPRPVLYHNQHYKQVGEWQAQRDIDHCLRQAEEAGTDEKRSEILAKRTGKGAAIGAVGGAVAGAIDGSVLKGGLIGAAVGGSVALTSGLLSNTEHSPVYMRFVEQCLFEKGYQPIGWQ